MKSPGELKELYRTHFFDSGDKINVIAAPGRLPLLGEHLAPAQGLALTVALDGYVYAAAQRRPDRDVQVYSASYDERLAFSLNSMVYDPEHGWANFPKGVLYYLERTGSKLPGFNMVLDADLPEGYGLASSTALSVATAFFTDLIGRAEQRGAALYRLCATSEKKFLDQATQEMDPLAIALAEEDSLMLHDHRSGERKRLPVSPELRLVIAESAKAASKKEEPAAERLARAREGLAKFARFAGDIASLRDLPLGVVDKHRLKVPVALAKACRHVASENDRAERVEDLLINNDLAALGRLVSESHASLRDDFKLSCPELETLLKVAADCPGLLGARMYGPGLGGNIYCLVRADRAAEFAARFKDICRTKLSMKVNLHTFGVSRGVHEM